ncbi:MAG: hypothetical protein ACE5DP_01740 [Fidelibacterota bacterium]
MKPNKATKSLHLFEGWTFTKVNYWLFGAGLILIFLGYIILALGSVNSFSSLTIAPVLLLLGYIGFIPAALIYREKQKE